MLLHRSLSLSLLLLRDLARSTTLSLLLRLLGQLTRSESLSLLLLRLLRDLTLSTALSLGLLELLLLPICTSLSVELGLLLEAKLLLRLLELEVRLLLLGNLWHLTSTVLTTPLTGSVSTHLSHASKLSLAPLTLVSEATSHAELTLASKATSVAPALLLLDWLMQLVKNFFSNPHDFTLAVGVSSAQKFADGLIQVRFEVLLLGLEALHGLSHLLRLVAHLHLLLDLLLHLLEHLLSLGLLAQLSQNFIVAIVVSLGLATESSRSSTTKVLTEVALAELASIVLEVALALAHAAETLTEVLAVLAELLVVLTHSIASLVEVVALAKSILAALVVAHLALAETSLAPLVEAHLAREVLATEPLVVLTEALAKLTPSSLVGSLSLPILEHQLAQSGTSAELVDFFHDLGGFLLVKLLMEEQLPESFSVELGQVHEWLGLLDQFGVGPLLLSRNLVVPASSVTRATSASAVAMAVKAIIIIGVVVVFPAVLATVSATVALVLREGAVLPPLDAVSSRRPALVHHIERSLAKVFLGASVSLAPKVALAVTLMAEVVLAIALVIAPHAASAGRETP